MEVIQNSRRHRICLRTIQIRKYTPICHCKWWIAWRIPVEPENVYGLVKIDGNILCEQHIVAGHLTDHFASFEMLMVKKIAVQWRPALTNQLTNTYSKAQRICCCIAHVACLFYFTFHGVLLFVQVLRCRHTIQWLWLMLWKLYKTVQKKKKIINMSCGQRVGC